jgi:hypothetical protein
MMAHIDMSVNAFEQEVKTPGGTPREDDDPNRFSRVDDLLGSMTMDRQNSLDRGSDAFEKEEASETPRDDPRNSIWRTIFMTLDEPETNLAGKIIAGVVMLMIFISSVAFVIVTMADVQADQQLMDRLTVTETVCIIAFTVEYLARVLTCWARPR